MLSNHTKPIRLLCFPYAGGNIYAYKALEAELPDSISMHTVELPGRGKRFGQNLITNVDEAVEDLWSQMKPLVDSPYAIFGHSMGAVLGYLVIQKIISLKAPLPVHLFCSGRTELWKERPFTWYLLPSNEFWEKIFELGGLPQPHLLNGEMKEIFEPILRADFQIIESVENTGGKSVNPIHVPISVILGKEDKLLQKHAAWQKHTTGEYSVHYFSGGHFYFLENANALKEIIVSCLNYSI